MSQPESNRSKEGLLRHLLIGGLRDFVWADIRDGRLRLNGLSRPVQFMIISGFLMVLYLLGVIIFNQSIRSSQDLISLTFTQATLGRGGLVSETAVPLTLFALTLGWSFMVAGAIRINRWLKYFIFYIYLLLFSQMFLSFVGAISVSIINPARIIQLLLAIGAYLLIPLFVIYRSFRPARPGFEFVIIFGLLGTFMGMAHLAQVAAWQEFGTALGFTSIELMMSTLVLLVLGFVVLIGVEIARFVRKTAVWSGAIIWYRLPNTILRPALFGLLLLLIVRILQQSAVYFQQQLAGDALRAYGGALLVPLSVIGLWELIKWLNQNSFPAVSESAIDETVDRYALPFIVGMILLALINVVLLLPLPILLLIGLDGLIDGLDGFTQWLTDLNDPFIILVGLVALGIGLWFGRQKRPLPALYLSIVGIQLFWLRITDPGQPLDVIGWQGVVPVDFWWMVLLVGVTAVWLIRRQLTERRAANLLMLTIIMLLLQQTDFIEDPFSPFFSFAGVSFLAFGILWELLTIGSWANSSSPGLPRLSRIYLYLGYVLISVATINWAFSQHNLFMVEQFTGGGALLGLNAVGRPMLYLLFPLLLSRFSEATILNNKTRELKEFRE